MRRLNGTWEPEIPMLTEKLQVEDPRGREYGCGFSRVSREAQARFREGLGVQLPGATRPSTERRPRPQSVTQGDFAGSFPTCGSKASEQKHQRCFRALAETPAGASALL